MGTPGSFADQMMKRAMGGTLKTNNAFFFFFFVAKSSEKANPFHGRDLILNECDVYTTNMTRIHESVDQRSLQVFNRTATRNKKHTKTRSSPPLADLIRARFRGYRTKKSIMGAA
jgi:hypothetical protein